MKINRELLPIKAHYFFFFAALGPILPQLNVFGRQLGVSPAVMGLVTAVLPLLWAAAKPTFGYLVDYFTTQRKFIFMLLIIFMTGTYCGLWFLPMPEKHQEIELEYDTYILNETIHLKQFDTVKSNSSLEKYNCHWSCYNGTQFEVWLNNSTCINTIYTGNILNNQSCPYYHMDFDDFQNDVICRTKDGCDLLCLHETLFDENDLILNSTTNIGNDTVKKKDEVSGNFYTTTTFWLFVILTCIGTVAFNVANCIGDAICFDVLGSDRGERYGSQRAWGTAGYGITALLGGWLVDLVSHGRLKDFTPAFILALGFTCLDLLSCTRLNLPSLRSPDDSGKALRKLLVMPRVIVFICFAVVAGTFDSFIIYYMFWYLEELAEKTNQMNEIKLIEGVIIAAQCFVGEILFFYLSGRIIKRWGHGVTLTFSLFCYGLRLALISFISHPWHLVFIEGIMQGPTYALCYATIVGYAAEVAPEGYSATVQGIVAGMDDGVGFALGSLLGGLLYSYLGGCISFQVMALIGILSSFLHALLFKVVSNMTDNIPDERKGERKAFDMLSLEEREQMLSSSNIRSNSIYRDTVIPLTNDNIIVFTNNVR